MKMRKVITGLLIVFSTFLLMGCGNGYRTVVVEDVDGDVTVEREVKGDSDTIDVFEDMKLNDGDAVEVGKKSSLVLLLDDDKHMCAEENTKFNLHAVGKKDKGEVGITIEDGNARFTIDNKLADDSKFEVNTPNATMSVRGTEFYVAYDKKNDVTVLLVEEGVVRTKYENGEKTENVEAGEARIITEDEVYKGFDQMGEDAGEILDEMNFGEFVFDSWLDEFNFDIDVQLPDEDDENSTDDATSNNDSNASIASGDDGVLSVKGTSRVKGYNDIVTNMPSYVANLSGTRLRAEYDQYDYIYFDYDEDGEKELVLYLRYSDGDRTEYLDLCFLDYYANEDVIKIRAINTGDVDDSCYYGNYNGKMARYSWRTSPYESYLYVLEWNDESLIYVLESSWDEILTDYDKTGQPLPLYGSWEMILE